MGSICKKKFFPWIVESSAGFGFAAFALAILVGTVAPLFLILQGGVESSKYFDELLKTSLTVAVGILMTGVVSVAVNNHNVRMERRAADREFRQHLISCLRKIHDRVKIAALLIDAHQSAKTYGEQMRELISVGVSVRDVRRTISSQPRAVGDLLAETLKNRMTEIARYLDEIKKEYREQYKRVSAIQFYSSAWDRERARNAAKKDVPPRPEEMVTSTVAWRDLQGAGFPMLKVFLVSDSSIPEDKTHETRFSKPLGDAINDISAID